MPRPALERLDRVVISTGGVATPGLERLRNGDLLHSCRRYQPEHQRWIGEVRRSRDGGRTWTRPILTIEPTRPDDPPGFLPYHGMIQLRDGSILLPCRGGNGGVFLMRSEDDGETWTGPTRIGNRIEGVDWQGIYPYGKMRVLTDGTLILPVWGRFRGARDGLTAHLRSADGGRTWDEFVVLARGQVAYNETIQLPDGRLMAIVENNNSPAGHGMSPFLWTWSEDLGRTWSPLDITNDPIYGNSPALFLTPRGNLILGYRWVGDLDQGFVGVGISHYHAEIGWDGVWEGSPLIVWIGRAIRNALGGRSFAGYPSFAAVDDHQILCAYFMSWMGGGDTSTQDIEGVFFAETE